MTTKLNTLFNTAQKFILIKDVSDDLNFELINSEFDSLEFNNNVDNLISKDMNFFDKDYLSGSKNTLVKYCEAYLQTTLNITDLFTGLKMTNSWGNITEANHGHHEHMHPFSIVSGVLFLDDTVSNLNLYVEGYMPDIPYFIQKNKSYISLKDILNDQQLKAEDFNNLKNHLVLFLSNSYHFVNRLDENASKRRSISFNTFWTGRTGADNHQLSSMVF